MGHEVLLKGLPADNPLGFLAALGTLVTVTRAWPRVDERNGVRLGWRPVMGGWRPLLQVPNPLCKEELVTLLHGSLSRTVDKAARAAAAAAYKVRFAKDTELSTLIKQFKALGRRAPPEDKREFLTAKVAPARTALDKASSAYRTALARGGAADPILELGAHPKQVPGDVFAQAAATWREAATPTDRRLVDLVAGLGCEAVLDKNDNIDPTQLSKANGSGNQFLLKDAGTLMTSLTEPRLAAALFAPWDYADRKLALGWNPAEVRDRALLATDPGKGGSRTIHGANRLAFEALALFPAVPSGRGLATTGNGRIAGKRCFTWPIWQAPLSESAVRTVLGLEGLQDETPDRQHLGRLGIIEVFRAEHFTHLDSNPRFRQARSV
ncbi:MAG: hypothetical protein WCK73_10195 [Deltaproteobacteria bacterium]